MSWLKVQVDVDEACVGPLETVLTAFGAVAIDFADAEDQPILEPEPGATPLWRRVRVTALFEPSMGQTEIQLAIASVMEPGALPPIRFGIIEDEDWVARLRDELVPLRFGEDLWICPPGKFPIEEMGPTGKTGPDRPARTIITMEPGLAFGTGTHPTTSLCMDWLANNPPQDRYVLDYGCGSGILGISALALGAATVTAVDIDRQALTATRENARRNMGGDRLVTCRADELPDSMTCDVLLANILSGTLIDLAPVLRKRCHAGTAIVLSGILREQADSVAAAYRDWAEMNAPIDREGWVLLTGTVN